MNSNPDLESRPQWIGVRSWSPARALVCIALVCSSGYGCAKLPLDTLPTVPVTVTVRDRDGFGIANVRVEFYSEGQYYSDHTDTTGVATLDVAPIRYAYFEITPPLGSGYSRPYPRQGVTVSKESSKFEYTFTGVRVTGTLYGPTGTPLDSGYVTLQASLSYNGALALTGPGGSFSLLVPAGAYSVTAGPWNRYSGLPTKRTDGVALAADTTFDVTIDGWEMTGIVSGQGGSPLVGAEIRLDGAPGFFMFAMSDGAGFYRLYAPSGGYRFAVKPSPPDGYILARTFPYATISGPTVRNFDLSGTEWTGMVRLTGTGDPVPSAFVGATLVDDYTHRSTTMQTDASGAFRMIVEPGREYDVHVYPPAGIALSKLFPGLIAGADSTFDLYVDPAPTP